jgi:hypothetical protein
MIVTAHVSLWRNWLLAGAACLAAVAALCGRAQEVPAAAPTAEDVADVFVDTNALPRDPFWPVGHVRRIPDLPQVPAAFTNDEPATTAGNVPLSWPKLTLKAMAPSPSGGYIGLLQGVGLVEGGEIIRMTRDGIEYRWRVVSVGPGGAVCDRIDARPVAAPRRGADGR